VAMIKENVKRCGLKNIRAEKYDATSLRDKDIENADIVIADLPCSGLGVIGNKPDIKYRVTKDDLTEITKLQKQILINAVKYLKKDGVLIYSTCTVNSQENEDMVVWITKELGLKLENIEPYINKKLYTHTTKKGYLQVIPGVFDMDGFFIARLIKC
jgi:16S rRNA (cytosine967-C5)-methyltransferase